MKCYLLANVMVHDQVEFAEYISKVPDMIVKYGGRYIVRAGHFELLEGELGIQRVVMVEFPSREAAAAFYYGVDYAPLLALRKRTTISQVGFLDSLGKDYVLGPDGDLNSAVRRYPAVKN